MTDDPHQTTSEKKRQDEDLDAALEDSFPASDPPALTNPSSFTGAEVASDEDAKAKSAHKRDKSNALDEQLEETFPASDTPSSLRKHGSDDA